MTPSPPLLPLPLLLSPVQYDPLTPSSSLAPAQAMDSGLDSVDAALALALDPRPRAPLAPSALLALLDPCALLPRLAFPPPPEAEGAEPPEYDGTDPGGYLVQAGLRPYLASTLVSEPGVWGGRGGLLHWFNASSGCILVFWRRKVRHFLGERVNVTGMFMCLLGFKCFHVLLQSSPSTNVKYPIVCSKFRTVLDPIP